MTSTNIHMNPSVTEIVSRDGITPLQACSQVYPKPSISRRLTFRPRMKTKKTAIRHRTTQCTHTDEDLVNAFDAARFPIPPSELFIMMYSDVLTTIQQNPLSGMVSPSLMGCSGIVVETHIGKSLEVLEHYRECIINAEKEVLLSAGFWKTGKEVRAVRLALEELNTAVGQRVNSQKVVVKILWDRGWLLHGAFRYHSKVTKKTQVQMDLPIDDLTNLSIEVMNFHRPLLGVLHTKYLIVDRKVLLIASHNLQFKPNQEIAVHFEGEIVNAYYDTFLITWGKSFNPPLPCAATPATNPPLGQRFRSEQEYIENHSLPNEYNKQYFHTPHAPIPMAAVNREPHGAPGHKNTRNPQDAAWLSAFHHAEKSIFIQTPDFNASAAVRNIRAACQRGVKVTLFLSYGYNDLKEQFPFQGGKNATVMKYLYHRLTKDGCAHNLILGWFIGKQNTTVNKKEAMCHIKFMAVDDQVAIVGSGNMDTQSWFHSAEVNIMLDSSLIVGEFLAYLRQNQNTYLYGIVDHSLAESPCDQIDRILSNDPSQQRKQVAAPQQQGPFPTKVNMQQAQGPIGAANV